MHNNIVLIGPMGAGKSAIGCQLAKKLDLPFLDTDHSIRERTGVDIDFIFEKEGEIGFRKRESAVLRELISGPPAVIATGGGIVAHPENREMLRTVPHIVFLETSVEWQLRRARRNQQRPLLEADDPAAILDNLYQQRLPFYRECATLTVDTDGRTVNEVVSTILTRLPDNYGNESR